MAIENPKRQLILAFLIFNVTFWLHIIASPKKSKVFGVVRSLGGEG
jgi:hypothetical protein